MTRFFLVFILFAGSYSINSQINRAGEILNRFSEITVNAPSISVNFVFALSGMNGTVTDQFEGTLILKGEKYKISTDNFISLFDGKHIYTIMPDVNEVMISDPDEEDGSLLSNPARLFSDYDKEFKYKLLSEPIIDGKRVYAIELTPINDSSEFSTIILNIDRETGFINSVIMNSAENLRYTLKISSYDATKIVTESFFQFNSSDYPGIEVIDLRW